MGLLYFRDGFHFLGHGLWAARKVDWYPGWNQLRRFHSGSYPRNSERHYRLSGRYSGYVGFLSSRKLNKRSVFNSCSHGNIFAPFRFGKSTLEHGHGSCLLGGERRFDLRWWEWWER